VEVQRGLDVGVPAKLKDMGPHDVFMVRVHTMEHPVVLTAAARRWSVQAATITPWQSSPSLEKRAQA